LDTNEYKNLFEFSSDLSQTVRTARTISGVRGTSAGSNVWVMKKTIGDRSGVVLANDPHSSLNLPAHWYQIHISCPEFNTVGLTSPGIPGFYIGRNDSLVWGVADIKLDDCDYFIEKIDSAHSDKYIDMTGESRKFKFVKDTINIKDDLNFVFYKRYTERSIVISDARIPGNINLSESDILNKFVDKYCLTYRWTGTEVTDEISSLVGISASRSIDEFDSALLSWGAPAVNFVFADKDANISVLSAGIVPNRNEKCNLILPNPGRYEEFGWKDDFNIIVSDVGSNPEKNYIIAANNKLSRDHDEFLSYYWEPPSRADRINELLKEFVNADDDEYTSIDARRMQNDVMSAYASDLLKVLIPVLIGNQDNMNEQEKQALILLAEWDNNLFPHTSAPTIYTSLLERLLYNTFADELADELYNEYSMISGFAGNKLAEIINNKRDLRFDDVNTEEKEVRDYMILKSFREALGRLNLIYPDSDIKDWKYGAVHGYVLRHKLSADKLLEGTVTVGPIETGGDNTTINNGERNYNQHFEALTGAAVRFISDSEEEYIFTSVPGGSSGNPLSKHYQDQIYLWHNGGYLTLSVSAVPDETFELKTLIRKSGQTE
ncbi:MAG: penicillin acylase family protein, partial [Chlorobi bacterium]|nr:penicillin acylase family protein [Chlorobiota bacterium]